MVAVGGGGTAPAGGGARRGGDRGHALPPAQPPGALRCRAGAGGEDGGHQQQTGPRPVSQQHGLTD